MLGFSGCGQRIGLARTTYPATFPISLAAIVIVIKLFTHKGEAVGVSIVLGGHQFSIIISGGSGEGSPRMACQLAPGARCRGRAEILVVALVGLATFAVLVPVLRRTYEMSLAVRCRSQLERIFTAVRNYALNYDGYPPCGDAADPARGWRERIAPFFGEPSEALSRMWLCPAGGEFVANAALWRLPVRRLDDFLLARHIGVVADGKGASGGAAAGDFARIDWRHRSGANVVFLDGHVDWVPLDRAWMIQGHWNRPQ